VQIGVFHVTCRWYEESGRATELRITIDKWLGSQLDHLPDCVSIAKNTLPVNDCKIDDRIYAGLYHPISDKFLDSKKSGVIVIGQLMPSLAQI
jgi:hypothetical protein